MKAIIVKTEYGYWIYLKEEEMTKDECLSFGKRSHIPGKTVMPVFQKGCDVGSGEHILAIVERTGKDAAFEAAWACKKIIEAL